MTDRQSPHGATVPPCPMPASPPPSVPARLLARRYVVTLLWQIPLWSVQEFHRVSRWNPRACRWESDRTWWAMGPPRQHPRQPYRDYPAAELTTAEALTGPHQSWTDTPMRAVHMSHRAAQGKPLRWPGCPDAD